MTKQPGTLLAADWGKPLKKRAVYKADVAGRAIERIDSEEWNLQLLLETAREIVGAGKGPVVVSLDLALGIPMQFFQSVRRCERWRTADSFIDWLSLLNAEPGVFWKEVKSADQWQVKRPFFSVPEGKGALTAFDTAAGYSLRREVDRLTRAKPLFAVSGIPGTVGSGTRCLWQELAPLLSENNRDFKVWPFEGRMDQLLKQENIIVAENYPAISYTSALRVELPGRKLIVYKTRAPHRTQAVLMLSNADWIATHGVTLPDLARARADEDDFDALMTAAAGLRCILEGYPLEQPDLDDPVAEGGMLLSSAVDFNVPGERLQVDVAAVHPRRRRTPKRKTRRFMCPIEGCTKVFRQGRSGWDSHVGSFSKHPDWHPNVRQPEERKRLFKIDFPGFFD